MRARGSRLGQAHSRDRPEISWDEFFEELDSRKLALVYDEDSLFSKIVSRDKQ